MEYCTYDEIVARIGPQVLTDLCRDPAPEGETTSSSAATSIVKAAISEAGTLIRAFCQGRYRLPTETDTSGEVPVIPDLVRIFTLDLSVYALYARRGHCEVPTSVHNQRDQALEWLEDVRRGELGLGDEAELYRISEATASVGGGPRLFGRGRA